VYLVGSATTYADILMAHCLTWFVEEVHMCIRSYGVCCFLIIFTYS
jgi:glutathione S-transferase